MYADDCCQGEETQREPREDVSLTLSTSTADMALIFIFVIAILRK